MSEPLKLVKPPATHEPLVRTIGLRKAFKTGDGEIEVLRGIDLSIGVGECVSIVGNSGVGKSTLLHILGALDRPTSGSVEFLGEDVFAKSSDELARFRSESLGFIFQFHHLLPEFNAVENVMMPGLIARLDREPLRARAVELLEEVGLGHRIDHPVGKMSGGERQRVAVARAVIREPAMVLADEPTGNLDPRTGDQVLGLLKEVNRAHRTGLIVVTHSPEIASQLGRKFVISDGLLVP